MRNTQKINKTNNPNIIPLPNQPTKVRPTRATKAAPFNIQYKTIQPRRMPEIHLVVVFEGAGKVNKHQVTRQVCLLSL
jgi:hypothetical protein